MIIHYYTLHHVTKELQSLIGCQLTECFSQERNSLVFKFSDGINNFYLLYFGTQPNTSLFLKKEYSRAKKNSVDLFSTLIGEVLQSAILLENNRIIRFDFINTTIYILLFGGSNSNLFAVNKEGIIIESLKLKKEYLGGVYISPKPNLSAITSFPRQTSIKDALSKCSFNLGRYYAEEVMHTVKINSDLTLQEIGEAELNVILAASEKVRSKCLESNEYFLLETEDGLILSLIPLKKYPKIIYNYYSISDAIAKRVFSNIRLQSFGSLYKELFNKLMRQKNRLEKNIAFLKDENHFIERAHNYKLYAELLLSHPNPKIKSGKEIQLTDFEGNEILIHLDEKKSILENANNFFVKSRKAKEEIKIRKKRLPDLELKLLKNLNALQLLEDAETYRELEIVKRNLGEITGDKTMNLQDNISTKFREFNLGEDFMVYVGKNANSNDELTMRFAKPNDYWFHARGSGGSHVVLRFTKDQKPPKEIIRKTASIAAYYSQARNAKYVPVAYTQKKYVRKPKGANIGSVIISKEEVIMVEPKLPDNGEKI